MPYTGTAGALARNEPRRARMNFVFLSSDACVRHTAGEGARGPSSSGILLL